MKKLFDEIKNDFEYFIKKYSYIVPVILTAIFSYGFVITHYTVNIDTLSDDRYFKDGFLIAEYRFGMIIFEKIFHCMKFSPFFSDLLAVVLLIVAATLFCISFKKITNNKINDIAYTLFSCLFISYPLIGEIFEYSPSGIAIGIEYILLAISTLCVNEYFNSLEKKYLVYITILLTIAIASYESMAAVYLCCICIYLILKFIYNKKEIKYSKEIEKVIKLEIPLLVAMILQYVISTILMAILDIVPNTFADKDVLYNYYKLGEVFAIFIFTLIRSLIINIRFYFPITILFIATLISIGFSLYYGIKRKNAFLSSLFIIFILAVHSLSFVLGHIARYRNSQTFGLFVAFIFMLLLQSLLESKLSKVIKNGAIIVLFTLVFYQAKDLHTYEYWNYLRYQHEKNVMIDIGNELQRNFDTEKPVVFVGTYRLPKYIEDKICFSEEDKKYIGRFYDVGEAITDSRVQSYIEWSIYAFREPNTELIKWLSMLGYDFKQGTLEMYKKAQEIKEQAEIYPKAGYAVDVGDFILVRFDDKNGDE